MQNLSAVLHKAKDLRLEHHDVGDPQAGEIQVRVQRCGVCMTDVHMVESGSFADFLVTQPFVIGHEYGGVIAKVGPGVTHLKPGDRVAVDSLIACGHCAQCKRGHSNVCERAMYVGFPPGGRGGLARLTNVPAKCGFKISDAVDFEEAAMMEPLSVSVNAVKRADVTMGDDVIVFGAGPIGLLTLQVARANGATSVCVADTDGDRLKLARDLGATHTVLFNQGETDARVNAQRLRDSLGKLADIAFECTGAPVCLQASIHAVRSRGVVVVVGLGAADVTIPVLDATVREIDIRGCICNNHCYPTSIKLLESGKVKVKPIISHRFRLTELPEALEHVKNHEVVKVMIDCSGD